MADFYVTSTAGGAGVGTEGDPFTLDQALDKTTYASDTIYVKSGTYTISVMNFVADHYTQWVGYDTVIGDQDTVWGDVATKPILKAADSAGIASVVSWGAFWLHIRNFVFDGNVANGGTTGLACITGSNQNYFNCVFKNGGTGGATAGTFYNCLADSNTTHGLYGAVSYCLSQNNGTAGFISSGAIYADNCVAYNNVKGFDSSNSSRFMNCTATGNSGTGFEAEIGALFINCISEDNGGWGYDSTFNGGTLVNCNAWNNTSGATTAVPFGFGLNTDDPALANPAGGDFTPGPNMYGLGATIGNINGTSNLDLGAMQSSKKIRPLP